MNQSVFTVGCDPAVSRAANRIAGFRACGYPAVSPFRDDAELPAGAVIVGPATVGSLAVGPTPGAPAITIAVVSDHAAGLAAVQGGADRYLLEADVDRPALDALAIAIGRTAGAGLAGAADNPNCVAAAAFSWLIQHSTDVVHRRREIGYVILLHLVPEPAVPPGRLAAPVCAALCATTRSADVVSWLGGHWFGVLVTTGLTLDGAHALAARLEQALLPGLPVDGRDAALRCNLGLTTFGGAPDTADGVLRRAMQATRQSAWSAPALQPGAAP